MDQEKVVLLICSSGISTGLLVKNMKEAATEQNLKLHIYSAPAITAEQIIKEQKVDALLIGPQSEYEIARLKDFLDYNNVPYRLIDEESYKVLDGEATLETALTLLGE